MCKQWQKFWGTAWEGAQPTEVGVRLDVMGDMGSCHPCLSCWAAAQSLPTRKLAMERVAMERVAMECGAMECVAMETLGSTRCQPERIPHRWALPAGCWGYCGGGSRRGSQVLPEVPGGGGLSLPSVQLDPAEEKPRRSPVVFSGNGVPLALGSFPRC